MHQGELMSLQGTLQIVTMAIIVRLHKASNYPLFEQARLSKKQESSAPINRSRDFLRHLVLLEHNIVVAGCVYYRRSPGHGMGSKVWRKVGSG